MFINSNFFRSAAVGALLAVSAVSSAFAEEAEDCALTINASAGFFTDYMWRGFNLYDGVSIQPTLTASYSLGDAGTISATHWMHLSAEGDKEHEGFTEMDETLTYTLAVDELTFTAGHIWYVYPDDDDEIADTAEFYGGATLAVFLNPTANVYYDYREYDMFYYELSFSQKFEPKEALGEGFNVTPFVTFGFASSAESVYDDNGLVHITEGVYSDLAMGDVSVRPQLAYTHKIDDATSNEFWAGFTLGYTF